LNRDRLLLGLVGAGIQASRTPAMHEREAAAQGLRCLYQLLDLDRTYGGAAARATFVATGALGLVWLPFWWLSYESARPTTPAGTPPAPREASPSWRQLLGLRQTWAYAVTKSLGDPIWWFYLFWLPKYLAADIGCLAASPVVGHHAAAATRESLLRLASAPEEP
jgi:hypothetical protein